MTRLSSITLNWRTKEDADLDDALPAFFKSASDLTWEQLRWAPNHRSIAIQLHHDHLPHEPRWSPKWYTSLLRRPGVSESVRQQYLALERALAKLRMRQRCVVPLRMERNRLVDPQETSGEHSGRRVWVSDRGSRK